MAIRREHFWRTPKQLQQFRHTQQHRDKHVKRSQIDIMCESRKLGLYAALHRLYLVAVVTEDQSNCHCAPFQRDLSAVQLSAQLRD